MKNNKHQQFIAQDKFELLMQVLVIHGNYSAVVCSDKIYQVLNFYPKISKLAVHALKIFHIIVLACMVPGKKWNIGAFACMHCRYFKVIVQLIGSCVCFVESYIHFQAEILYTYDTAIILQVSACISRLYTLAECGSHYTNLNNISIIGKL